MLYIFANTVVYIWKESYKIKNSYFLHWKVDLRFFFMSETSENDKSTFQVKDFSAECNFLHGCRKKQEILLEFFWVMFFSFSEKNPNLPIKGNSISKGAWNLVINVFPAKIWIFQFIFCLKETIETITVKLKEVRQPIGII